MQLLRKHGLHLQQCWLSSHPGSPAAELSCLTCSGEPAVWFTQCTWLQTTAFWLGRCKLFSWHQHRGRTAARQVGQGAQVSTPSTPSPQTACQLPWGRPVPPPHCSQHVTFRASSAPTPQPRLLDQLLSLLQLGLNPQPPYSTQHVTETGVWKPPAADHISNGPVMRVLGQDSVTRTWSLHHLRALARPPANLFSLCLVGHGHRDTYATRRNSTGCQAKPNQLLLPAKRSLLFLTSTAARHTNHHAVPPGLLKHHGQTQPHQVSVSYNNVCLALRYRSIPPERCWSPTRDY